MKKYTLIVLVLSSFAVAQIDSKTAADYIDKNNTLISNQKQLTFVGARSGEGYFSADGKTMIYQSEREEGNPFYQMFLLDLVTGKSTRISTGLGMTTCGWVHPSLKKAMWSSTHLDPDFKQKVKAEYEERAKPVKKRYSWNYDNRFDIFESDLHGKKKLSASPKSLATMPKAPIRPMESGLLLPQTARSLLIQCLPMKKRSLKRIRLTPWKFTLCGLTAVA